MHLNFGHFKNGSTYTYYLRRGGGGNKVGREITKAKNKGLNYRTYFILTIDHILAKNQVFRYFGKTWDHPTPYQFIALSLNYRYTEFYIYTPNNNNNMFDHIFSVSHLGGNFSVQKPWRVGRHTHPSFINI